MGELGYACINETLRYDGPGVYTGRTITEKRFTLERVSRLALANARDLYTILKWNEEHNIKVFRIGSDLFPRRSENYYSLEQLPDKEEIVFNIRRAGRFAEENGHTISMHPSQFVVLASPSESVVSNATNDIMVHAEFLDLFNPRMNSIINFHIGGTYGGKFKETAHRFNKNFLKLPENIRKKIAIENDDKPDGWSVKKLYDYVYSETGVPLTYDYHHSRFSKEADISFENEYAIAKSTWHRLPNEVHYSESAPLPALPLKHSEYLNEKIPDFLRFDSTNYIIIEAKKKEQALLDYRKKFESE